MARCVAGRIRRRTFRREVVAMSSSRPVVGALAAAREAARDRACVFAGKSIVREDVAPATAPGYKTSPDRPGVCALIRPFD